MQALRALFRIDYGQRLFLLATIPLVLAMAGVAMVVTNQARVLAEEEIRVLEQELLEAKRQELRNYIAIARTAINPVYGRAGPNDAAAKLRVTQILSALIYGREGYFFVFDYDGTNLVAPRQTELIQRNWAGLTDPSGTPIVDELIARARSGAGYHEFEWTRPSSGEPGRMIAYVIGLQDWQWAIGTGVFIDDVLASVAAARATTEARLDRTFLWISAVTLLALLAVFATGLALTQRERRVADTKLKALTQRVLDTQEEERGRVARELHDSISQLLVGIRYALELARRRVDNGDARASANIERGIDGLNEAIHEVRRISRDLRPGQLDDLGLGPAIQSLAEEFSTRTGIETDVKTVVFRNRLDKDAKIALYRIAQEALTNIERHAEAGKVKLELFGHKRGATLRVSDNGCGMEDASAVAPGLGLRNMAERMEQLDGTLRVLSSDSGTQIEATVPLSHILPPDPDERVAAPEDIRRKSA
ncbi:cache domain-containing protein [Tropicimonas sp. S265A]|uniref:cache domain-containing protein n=1 Tax=Tropicimonas sp. S265A TaxID=3415134 RepID=UPI003C7E4C48